MDYGHDPTWHPDTIEQVKKQAASIKQPIAYAVVRKRDVQFFVFVRHSPFGDELTIRSQRLSGNIRLS